MLPVGEQPSQTRQVSISAPHRPSETLLFPLVQGSVATSFRLVRRPDGTRVALAFSDATGLHTALGADVPAVRLCLAAARAMLGPVGVEEICVDPHHVVVPSATRGRAA